MNHPTIKHSDLNQWLAECGALQPIELAQCLDDLCDGSMISPRGGYDNYHALIFKLRCLGLEIIYFPLSDFEGIPDAYDFYLMPDRQCDTARLLHEAMLNGIVDRLAGDGGAK